MKRVLIVVMLVVGAASLGLWRSHGGVRAGLSKAVGMSEGDSQGEAHDEVRKTFVLQPGARLEVEGINGKVDIQTSDTKTAEVYLLRTGKNSESLSRRQVTIEQTATGLVVRGRETRHVGIWDHLFGSNPKEELTIKAPRQIALALKGINGRVTTGEIEGTIEAKGINGNVELGQASESAEINGINGRVVVSLKQLGERGARLNGINGGIELRLANGLNADLTAKGMNGSVRSEIPEVTVDKEEFGHGYSAHIGSGGAPITLAGINGNVRLTRGEGQPSSTATTEKKAVTEKVFKSDSETRHDKSVQ
ncbi:MAG: hypothetical protein QOJ88_48 [Pyrinomonadaceae bacterium]|nr:hypothetical protein [Pyrinomonadaceae bacterium]